MARRELLLIVVFVLLLLAFSAANVSKRNVSTTLYPDCRSYNSCMSAISQNATAQNASFPNLAYVRAEAVDNDVLHFVMTTINFPSILVVHTTKPGAKLNFDWNRLLSKDVNMSGAINVTGTVDYSFLIIFSRLIEYDDINDGASLNEVDPNDEMLWNIRSFTEFDWMNMTIGQGGNSVIFNTTFPQLEPYENNTSGSISFEFEINGDDGRDSELPRLIYNANNTQMNFALDNYIPMFNQSRFALEVSIVGNHSDDMLVEKRKSIDDEYSPGVFRTVNWFSRNQKTETGYLQWKPVCYLGPGRGRALGTEVMDYDLQDPDKVKVLPDLLSQSVALAFYGDTLNETKAVIKRSSNVSFGLSEDGFYVKHNYTVWTASIGYGSAPAESISTMVIIIIAAGLGLPVILILIGSIYVCVKKRRGDYEEIGGDDDDVLSRDRPRLN